MSPPRRPPPSRPFARRASRAALAVLVFFVFVFFIFAFFGGAGMAAEGPDPLLLEEGRYLEDALDPRGAAEAYEAYLRANPVDSRLAAVAHLRLGICRRLLDDDAAARREFETVARDFPAIEDAARAAKTYLERGSTDVARFMPRDSLLYVELVEPSEHIKALSGLVVGTPFQNPVDYYVSFLSRRSGEKRESPLEGSETPRVVPAAAFLNEAFFREAQKIEGLALAIPAKRRADDDFVGVFLPGSSDILRGLAQAVLTLSLAQGAGSSEGFPLLRVPPGSTGGEALLRVSAPESGSESEPEGWLHVSFAREAIVFGRPRTLVEETLRRVAKGGDSLAASPDYRLARSARLGSALFAYLDAQASLSLLEGAVPAVNRSVFEELEGMFGLRSAHSVSFSLAYSEVHDGLRMLVQSRHSGEALPLWQAFRTRALEPKLLAMAPPGASWFFATECDRGSERVEAAWRALELLSRLDPRPEPNRALGAALAQSLLRAAPTRAFLDSLSGILFGALPAPGLRAPLDGFVVLRFRDPAVGQELIDDFLRSTLRVLAPAIDARARPETLRFGALPVEARCIEPFVGVRLRYFRLGDFHLLGFADPILSAVVSRLDARDTSLAVGRASKRLFLRPAAGLAAEVRRAEWPREARIFLDEIDEAVISTREGADSFSVELILPSVTPKARRILSHIAEGLLSGDEAR